MATGHFDGKDAHDPAIRSMFSKEYLLASSWYQQRLSVKQHREIELWRRHVSYLENFSNMPHYADAVERLQIKARLEGARIELEKVANIQYLEQITGTIGADPIGKIE